MKKAQPDPLWDALIEHCEHILYLYGQFADRHPVMLLDIQEGRIYAYPYREFVADLSSRSQASLAKQYPKAVANGQMLVFVRDNLERRLVSYILPCEADLPAATPAATKRKISKRKS